VVETAVYRVAQEGLANVRKHANSDSAHVVLNYDEPAQVILEVRDDGQGSDGQGSGFGLLGLRERVQLLGGTLIVETAKGQGFVLRAAIPG
jgi:signal transduction histidine kinase